MNGFRELKQRFAEGPRSCSHACSHAEHKAVFQRELARYGGTAGL